MLEKIANISPLTSHVVVFFLGSLTVFLSLGQSEAISSGAKQNIIWRQLPVAKLQGFQEGEDLVLLKQPLESKAEDPCKVDQMVWRIHWDEEGKVPILYGKEPATRNVHLPTARELMTKYSFSRLSAARVVRSCQVKKTEGIAYASP